jgi:hypothetical protein
VLHAASATVNANPAATAIVFIRIIESGLSPPRSPDARFELSLVNIHKSRFFCLPRVPGTPDADSIGYMAFQQQAPIVRMATDPYL